jgi:hypothetical protein
MKPHVKPAVVLHVEMVLRADPAAAATAAAAAAGERSERG